MLSPALDQPAVVVGDLVRSRDSVDRPALHRALLEALAITNRRLQPAEGLAPTIGDEFQGVFHRAVDAVRATLLVRASMDEPYDVRFGIGLGEVVILDDTGSVAQQDGPGWWAARDAIEFVSSAGRRRALPATLRTWVDRGELTRSRPYGAALSSDPGVRAVNSYLVTRDQLVTAMSGRDRRILRGLLLGHSLREIAETEGITTSAVSQRSRRSGAAAVVYADAALGGNG